MSYAAMGWAQRQQVGSPQAKAVLHTLCYVMFDECLEVWASIPYIAKNTEYDERTVRKALQHLAELGITSDTGQRKNNCPVWRIPRFEQWLDTAYPSPPINERAIETPAAAGAQGADSPAESTDEKAGEMKPPQKCQGLEQAPPFLQPSPPIFAAEGAQAPPKTSPNLLRDLSGSTKPARPLRLGDWKAAAKLRHDRAPERHGKEVPAGSVLKPHLKFWRRMVDWYGNLWLVQTGEWPELEWIRLLNVWNDSGRWTELDRLLESMLLERPDKPPMLGEIDALFRKLKGAAAVPFDAKQSESYWWNYAIAALENGASALGICGHRTRYTELRDDVRSTMLTKCREFTVWAVAEERAQPRDRRRIEKQLESKIADELDHFRPPTPAETQEYLLTMNT